VREIAHRGGLAAAVCVKSPTRVGSYNNINKRMAIKGRGNSNFMGPDQPVASAQEGLGKLAGVEGFQVFKLLAHADEVHGNRLFAGNGTQHATLGRAV